MSVASYDIDLERPPTTFTNTKIPLPHLPHPSYYMYNIYARICCLNGVSIGPYIDIYIHHRSLSLYISSEFDEKDHESKE